MSKSGISMVLLFLCACFVLFVHVDKQENVTSALQFDIEDAKLASPVPWSEIKGKEDNAAFEHLGNWVIVEKAAPITTALVFTHHAKRDGNSLVLDYWGYTFNQSGEVVASGLSSYTIKGYFKGTTTDPNMSYLPPQSILNVYPDKSAPSKDQRFQDGDIGIEFDESTNYALPWGKGVYTRRVENPRES